MKEITFSYNWNKKLDCRCFTTLRLSDNYKVGQQYKVILKSGKDVTAKGVAQIVEIKRLSLDQINNFIAHIDTGYSVKECIEIIARLADSKIKINFI